MRDFMIFMHGDTRLPEVKEAWEPYLVALRERGVFGGGSAFGPAMPARKGMDPPVHQTAMTGYIRISVENVTAAQVPRVLPGKV